MKKKKVTVKDLQKQIEDLKNTIQHLQDQINTLKNPQPFNPWAPIPLPKNPEPIDGPWKQWSKPYPPWKWPGHDIIYCNEPGGSN